MLCGDQALDMFSALLKINATKVFNYSNLECKAKIHINPSL